MTSKWLGTCVLVAIASFGLGACGGGGGSGTTVDVTAADFTLTPSVSSAPAGTVSFQVHNTGSFGHELVVVKAAQASDLPTKPDGEVDEGAVPKADQFGEVTGVVPSQTKTLKVKLPAGKYVLFCNSVDGANSVHFKRGMHTDFTVTP